MNSNNSEFSAPIVSGIVSETDIELIIDRVFKLFDMARSEVCLVIKELKHELHGYWAEPGYSEMNGGFMLESHSPELSTVCVSSRLVSDPIQFIRTLAHELQHHTQWRDGRLVEMHTIEDRKMHRMWDGVPHPTPRTHGQYLILPWEVDARQAEETILDQYLAAYVHPSEAAA